MAELLLLFGADPTIPNKNGFTSLHVAARHGHIDIVNLLINKGRRETTDRDGPQYQRQDGLQR